MVFQVVQKGEVKILVDSKAVIKADHPIWESVPKALLCHSSICCKYQKNQIRLAQLSVNPLREKPEGKHASEIA